MPAIKSRIPPSSSTTRISDGIGDPVLLILIAFLTHSLLYKGEGQLDLGALATLRVPQRNFAPMVFHDLAHDRQTQPGALGAGGDIRFGQAMAMLGGKADAIVADLEREGRAIRLKRHRDLARRFVARGETRGDPLTRILQDIGKRLADQPP